VNLLFADFFPHFFSSFPLVYTGTFFLTIFQKKQLATSIFNSKRINAIRKLLIERNETIAVAESVTSGMLQLAFSTADKAIYFYQGGITTYNLGQKSRHLNIDPIYARECNCVSGKTVNEMAINVCRLFSSDWGIAVTGYASPVPESGNKLFAWYSLAYHGNVVVTQEFALQSGNPFDIQLSYCNKILNNFHQILNKKSPVLKKRKKAKGAKEQ